jgi:hypothetical protein
MSLVTGLKQKQKSPTRRLSRTLSAGIVIASLAAFGWVASGAVKATDSLADIRWGPFAGAIVLQLVMLVFLMLLWERLLGILASGGSDAGRRSLKFGLYSAYSRTWLARYIPGRVWALGGRMLLASRMGVPADLVARSMAFEVLLTYSLVAVIGGALLVTAHFHLGGGVALLVLGLLLVGISVPIAQRMFVAGEELSSSSSLWTRTRRQVQKFIVGVKPLTFKNTVWAVSVYAAYSALQLLFIVLITASFVDLSLTQALIIAGAWGVSITLGWLTFLVPVGLGVRDGLAFVLFSQVIDAPTASLIVAASRIVMIGADMIFVGMVEALVLGTSIRQTQPQASA